MTKHIISKAMVAALPALALLATSCSEDDLNPQSIITTSTTAQQTDFDKWLQANYVGPYNIQFVYRYQDNETDMNYYQVPADYNQAVKMAHIVKYTCIDAYDEVAGVDFTRAYFPKMLYLSGTWEFQNNGTFILGTAEGGKKIFLAGVNYLDMYIESVEYLNHYYLKTIHHEFTHILNQTKNYSQSYQLITGTGYVADSWSESPYGDRTYALQNGFITSYAQHSHGEDFAEMLAEYVTNDQATWDGWMETAGESADLIQQKLDIVRDYMQTAWNIDIDALRSSVLGREGDVVNGAIDLSDLTVK